MRDKKICLLIQVAFLNKLCMVSNFTDTKLKQGKFHTRGHGIYIYGHI